MPSPSDLARQSARCQMCGRLWADAWLASAPHREGFMAQGRLRFCPRCDMGQQHEGICPSCQSRYPAFVPKDQLRRDRVTPGYILRSTGMVRYDQSDIAKLKWDAKPLYQGFSNEVFGRIPHNPKRTEQQRVDSLHRRIADTIARFGTIPASILRDVQREQIAQGKAPMTGEQLRQLAGFYLTRAHNEEEAKQRKLIVRTA